MLLCHELEYACQNYGWGKIGFKSMVAQLGAISGNISQVLSDKPYAELWLGTHKNGPSYLKKVSNEKKTLVEHLKNKPSNRALSYLLKVLSINQVLSIQAHPDKKTASELFHQYPEIYKDENHKPEMAIAITKFKAMCGFRPLSQVKDFFIHIPHMEILIGTGLFNIIKSMSVDIDNNATAEFYRDCFFYMVNLDIEIIENLIICHRKYCQQYVTDKINENCVQYDDISLHNLFLKISKIYPQDFGCFSIYFLNVFELKPGQAIFIHANIPHSYIYGECIECMANSDNVIRLGLTPKFKHITTALKIVDFRPKSLNDFIVLPKIYISSCDDIYRSDYYPLVDEFAVSHIHAKNNKQLVRNSIILKYNTIVLILDGQSNVTLHSIDNSHMTQEITFSKGCAYLIDFDCYISKFDHPNSESVELWLAYKP